MDFDRYQKGSPRTDRVPEHDGLDNTLSLIVPVPGLQNLQKEPEGRSAGARRGFSVSQWLDPAGRRSVVRVHRTVSIRLASSMVETPAKSPDAYRKSRSASIIPANRMILWKSSRINRLGLRDVLETPAAEAQKW